MLVSATLWVMDTDGLTIQLLMPIAYAAHTLWFFFLIYICKVSEQKNGVMLPTGYRAVLYIDVYGWIKRNVAPGMPAASASDSAKQFQDYEQVTGAGPALDGVKYESGRPVPMRIEQLPGANKQPRPADMSKTHFAPSTFVPTNVPGEDITAPCPSYEPGTAGRRPWTVFRVMTLGFATLWLVSGVIIVLQLYGLTNLSVAPQLDEEVRISALEAGEQVSTGWPHSNVQPIGLACDATTKTMVASSRFGLYTADLSKLESIHFEAAPACAGIEGDSLKDVSLQCSAESSFDFCHAVVLHQHGRRVTTCSIRAHANATVPAATPATISGQWLGGQSGNAHVSVQSLAIRSKCFGQEHGCAYVGTADHRLIEMLDKEESGARSLFPRRVLGTKTSVSTAVPGGAMDVIHDRYLGIL